MATTARRVLAVVLLVLALPASVVLTAVPASAQGQAAYVREARAATSAERTERGLSRLSGHGCLQRAAQRQAQRMARTGRLHHSPDFGRIGRRCGVATWGENVAQVPGSGRGRDVVRLWMGSPGHRANILNPRFRLLGLAAVRRDGAWWVVQVFGRRG